MLNPVNLVVVRMAGFFILVTKSGKRKKETISTSLSAKDQLGENVIFANISGS